VNGERLGMRKCLLLVLTATQAACASTSGRAASQTPGVPGEVLATVPGGAQGTSRDAARTIGPRDLLDVSVFEAEELSRTMRVSDAGDISMPLLGVVRAEGRTTLELAAYLEGALRGKYMLDPHVAVEVKEAATQSIYVLGEVVQPGSYTASNRDGLTVLRAVAAARGVKPTAKQKRAIVIRPQPVGEPLQIPVNLDDVVKGKSTDLALLPNDVVYVPRNSERAVAIGVIEALMSVVTFKAVF
jgi:polysaccharide biosynthesis/export protein